MAMFSIPDIISSLFDYLPIKTKVDYHPLYLWE
jgi:hypothetical protein